MKYLSLIIFLVYCNFCLGQNVRFQLYRTRPCTTIEQIDTSYYITVLGKLDTAFVPKSGIVHLPGTGHYSIGFTDGPILDSPFFEVRDTGLFIYRYKEARIAMYEGGLDSPPVYVECGKSINGYKEDFYPNGNLKIRGDFNHGYPKDSIVKFYTNGKVKKRVIYLPKVINTTEFDSTGNLIKIAAYQNKSFMNYREYKWTEFFPNGKVKRAESSLKRVLRFEEYYPEGQLKLKQTKNGLTEYYNSGQKSITYTWKYKTEHIMHGKNFTIFKNEYDENGQVLQSDVYEAWNLSWPQPELDITKSDWIIRDIKYKNGKQVNVVEDVDTKFYFKNESTND